MKKIAEFRKSGNMNQWWNKIKETVDAVNELIDGFKSLERGLSDLDKTIKDNPEQLELIKEEIVKNNPEQLELIKEEKKDEVDILIEKGVIEKKGNWYCFKDGNKILGRKKLMEYLKKEK